MNFEEVLAKGRKAKSKRVWVCKDTGKEMT
jgi:hypothetical protein